MSGVAPRDAVAPTIDSASAGFWAALAVGRLVVPHCNSCARNSFPPMPACPLCGSLDIDEVEVSGAATIYSWTTVHVALSPAFVDDVPYTVIVAELCEGGRMLGRLLDDSGVRPTAGAPVQFKPYRVADVALPGFRLRALGDSAEDAGKR